MYEGSPPPNRISLSPMDKFIPRGGGYPKIEKMSTQKILDQVEITAGEVQMN